MSQRPMTRRLLLAALATTLLTTAACDDKKKDASGEDAAAADAPDTAGEEAEATKEEDAPKIDKLIYAFQPQENPEGLQLSTEKFAEFMEKETGIETEIFIPTSYGVIVEALRNDNAHVAYFSGWPYLIAYNTADVELLVAEVRDGNPYYYSQWYTTKESGIESLADLEGEPIAFTSRTSTSGYLFPLSKVIEEGHLEQNQDPKEYFGEVLYAGGYDIALKSLLAGKVKAAAASDYAPGRYLSEEERAQLRVLTKQGPAPTHGIAIKKSVPKEIRDKVQTALLKLNEPEHKELLKSIYGAEKLVARGHDEHVAPLAKAQKLVGADYPLKKDEESKDAKTAKDAADTKDSSK